MLYLLNRSYQTEDVIDDADSTIWTERYNKAGDFELYLSSSLTNFAKYKQDYYVWSDESTRLMIVEDVEVKTSDEDGSYLTVTGRSYEAILDRRIVWYRVTLTGNLQAAIKKLVNDNAINTIIPGRKIPGLTFKDSTDPKITALTIDAQYHGESLLTTVTDICNAYDIGFRITMSTPGNFVFELYSGVDRSYAQTKVVPVVFSPTFDNLGSSNYLQSKRNARTIALIGGEGEGSARKIVSANLKTGPASGIDRREIFVDAGGMSSTVDNTKIPENVYLNQLQQKGYEELRKNKSEITFDGQIVVQDQLLYNKHYFMGDIVQMENEHGTQATSRITEFIRSSTQTGTEAYPTIESIEL